MKFPLNHDLHCHSVLSECSSDPEMTLERILRHAEEHGYSVQCITDHLWDAAVPGASKWYAPQDIAHVKQSLPLPKSDSVKLVFGCETEYVGGSGVAIAPEHYDEFDFIVIPPNHFHMVGLTRPREVDTEEKAAELFTARLEELSALDLPWKKIGIAHLTCGLTFREGDYMKVFRIMDEERLKAAFKRFAENGAGIELNSGSIGGTDWRGRIDDELRLYRIARDMGCKFYCATDAHHPAELETESLREIADRLELTDKELFPLP